MKVIKTKSPDVLLHLLEREKADLETKLEQQRNIVAEVEEQLMKVRRLLAEVSEATESAEMSDYQLLNTDANWYEKAVWVLKKANNKPMSVKEIAQELYGVAGKPNGLNIRLIQNRISTALIYNWKHGNIKRLQSGLNEFRYYLK